MANTINATSGGIVSTGDSTADLNIQTGGSTAIAIGTGQSVVISNLSSTTFSATTVSDSVGNVRNIPSAGAAKTSAYTLSISDIGEFVTVGTSGSITVPNDIFSAGNAVSIYNNTTGNITITCSITTAYIAGTDTDKATMTLATRGIATFLFINPSLCVATGNLT
jgi:hypothetical protein